MLVRSQFLGGVIPVRGWAFDCLAQRAVRDVYIQVDDARPVRGEYGADRPDVAVYYRQPGYLRVGYYALVPLKMLAPGAHTLSLRAVVQGAEEVETSHTTQFVID